MHSKSTMLCIEAMPAVTAVTAYLMLNTESILVLISSNAHAILHLLYPSACLDTHLEMCNMPSEVPLLRKL